MHLSTLAKQDFLVGPPQKRQPSPKAIKSVDENTFRNKLVRSIPREDDSPSSSPRRRASPKSTKSLDGKEFRSQLGHSQVTFVDKIEKGSDKRGTVSNAPASLEPSSICCRFPVP
jgi:hypothetical protein